KQNRALLFCFDAFSSREPVSTSLENAITRRYLHPHQAPGWWEEQRQAKSTRGIWRSGPWPGWVAAALAIWFLSRPAWQSGVASAGQALARPQSMIRTRRAALAQSGSRFSEKIMLKRRYEIMMRFHLIAS